MSFNVLTQGTGRPLLLLHGFTGSARAWAAQIEVWSETHRVIAPDLLGHAGSEAPQDPARHALDRQAGPFSLFAELNHRMQRGQRGFLPSETSNS